MEIIMPFARIDLIKGKTPEYRAAVADIVYRGIVDVLKAPDGDRFPEFWERNGEDAVVLLKRVVSERGDQLTGAIRTHLRAMLETLVDGGGSRCGFRSARAFAYQVMRNRR
jgi:hypothetical protein